MQVGRPKVCKEAFDKRAHVKDDRGSEDHTRVVSVSYKEKDTRDVRVMPT